jgi:hypothetical protein
VTYNAPTQKWQVSAYCKNITEETILGTGTSGTVGGGIFYKSPLNPDEMRYAAIEPPRTFGLTVSLKF